MPDIDTTAIRTRIRQHPESCAGRTPLIEAYDALCDALDACRAERDRRVEWNPDWQTLVNRASLNAARAERAEEDRDYWKAAAADQARMTIDAEAELFIVRDQLKMADNMKAEDRRERDQALARIAAALGICREAKDRSVYEQALYMAQVWGALTGGDQ